MPYNWNFTANRLATIVQARPLYLFCRKLYYTRVNSPRSSPCLKEHYINTLLCSHGGSHLN
uniref:Uncharacterized protein n=1 Tax=Xenopus tropicalis TaxID=8364 RepID=A0A803KDD7_XENTR